jgi:3-hydroxyisobutyrate dehydrogenase-like beta-hydroxyacid dehydrogenase
MAAADEVGPVFDVIGRKTVWLGEVGQGSQVKLAGRRTGRSHRAASSPARFPR